MAIPLRYAILFSAQILILLSVCFLFQSLNITDQLRQILRRRKQHPGIHLKARLMDQLSLSRSDFDITARYLFLHKKKNHHRPENVLPPLPGNPVPALSSFQVLPYPRHYIRRGAWNPFHFRRSAVSKGCLFRNFPKPFLIQLPVIPDPLSLRYPPAVPFPESHSRYFPPGSS